MITKNEDGSIRCVAVGEDWNGQEPEGQRFLSGVGDEVLARISRRMIKAASESELAAEEKKFATKVAKIKDTALSYFTVRASIEAARVKSLEDDNIFICMDIGEGPVVEVDDTWQQLNGAQKVNSVLYARYCKGVELQA